MCTALELATHILSELGEKTKSGAAVEIGGLKDTDIPSSQFNVSSTRGTCNRKQNYRRGNGIVKVQMHVNCSATPPQQ